MHRYQSCKKKVVEIIPTISNRRKIIAETIDEVRRKNRPPTPDPRPIDPVDITIIPTVYRYFYVPAANINLQSGATLPATLFYSDNGSDIEEFILSDPNGYVNLYINGVMQEGGFYSVDAQSLTLIPTEGRILAGTPIIIQSIGHTAIPVQP
ncbi:DUF4183 domain-containing protein [Sporosarcina sp. HYO08]|uniref:DUF4183 domain-containing protein n=1 Tax=Sporosarcina sp. HYO08 TaxID=1759557 RepID=UPI0007972E83|nr:DUF4183 domain-containing protein [Sporosarcina sp. HYO08]KXH80636.1 hypothetical protein AU377_07775 [Sporosarcina sp. HYO08]